MTICTACGSDQNKANARFCGECGTKLSDLNPLVKAVIAEGSKLAAKSLIDAVDKALHESSTPASFTASNGSVKTAIRLATERALQSATSAAVKGLVHSSSDGQSRDGNSKESKKIDRSRRFSLPGVDQLTREQDLALELPVEGNHLLIGGPGTGKSVIALLRASRLVRTKKSNVFLAYNRLLIHASRALAPVPLAANTWISWFRQNWREQMGQTCPDLGKPYLLDWISIEKQIRDSEDIPSPDHDYLVIDEGQDMPERFYLALADLGFKHIFVVADFNQVLYPDRSCNRKQLVDCLAKDRRNVQDASAKKECLLDDSAIIQLKYNHRNPGPVARLANYLCNQLDNPQSTCPELRNDMRDAEVPILYGYDPSNPTNNLSSVARRILLTADRDPRKLIGVLCPTIEVRNQYKKELDDALALVRARLDYGDVRIELFDASQQAEPDFTQGGIVILTAQSCKGLEFDIVVIADLDWYRSDSGKVQLLYVMVSRAYERVILLRNLARSCPLDEILPADEDLLKRVM